MASIALRADPRALATVQRIADLAHARGGRALVVGGAVRDAVRGLPSVDLDVEVYGLAPDALESMLGAEFALDRVGVSFGILKLKETPIDVSLPRRESKAGLGHRGFEVFADPGLTIAEAASRRDFTINAMAYDPRTGELLDPYAGANDLAAGVLRHTSAAFVEDPLRVLRAMQFAARLDLRLHPDTAAIARTVNPEGLARERLYGEWEKLLLKGVKPSRGLAVLKETGWLSHFPELAALDGCAQDPEYHPEGDAFIHTGFCLDHFATERTGVTYDDLLTGFAVLAHDFGKATTTARGPDGRWRSHGHAEAGVAPTCTFIGRLTNQADLLRDVPPLVAAHMQPDEFFARQVGDAAIRRLATRVGRIDLLVRVVRADHGGRPPMPFTGVPAGDWLLARAAALAVTDRAPRPLVQGRHLIELGLKPGKSFGAILQACYEAQLDGGFATIEDGTAFAETLALTAPRVGATSPSPTLDGPRAVL
ncbi:MAG: polynucleotide adenylyltransferase [Gemmatimonadaceae bacterium]|nr:polynucleotide adenylyltransferase [Gemmatimonadaceae bacterium]